jgi:5'-3' exonuclease
MSKLPKYCLVDVGNLVHRAKHVIRDYEDFDDCVGMTLTIVFQSMRKVYEKFNATHCVACFDSYSWRKAHYPEYKANRNRGEQTPEEAEHHDIIIRVLQDLQDFLTRFTNVTVLEGRGIEADDFIARWVQIHDDPIFSHVIISADGDFKQLVGDNVELYNPISNTLYRKSGVYFQDGKRPKRGEPLVQLYHDTWKVRMRRNKVKKDIEIELNDGRREIKTIEEVVEGPEIFDAEWELFLKCIRGDSSDNIKAAFPRIHETVLRQAFADKGGEKWNNVINGFFKLGDENKPVRPLYDRNRMLIDLKAQPEEIKEKIDDSIYEAMQKDRKQLVQAYFIKFCNKYRLVNLSRQADSITGILASPYNV